MWRSFNDTVLAFSILAMVSLSAPWSNITMQVIYEQGNAFHLCKIQIYHKRLWDFRRHINGWFPDDDIKSNHTHSFVTWCFFSCTIIFSSRSDSKDTSYAWHRSSRHLERIHILPVLLQNLYQEKKGRNNTTLSDLKRKLTSDEVPTRHLQFVDNIWIHCNFLLVFHCFVRFPINFPCVWCKSLF